MRNDPFDLIVEWNTRPMVRFKATVPTKVWQAGVEPAMAYLDAKWAYWRAKQLARPRQPSVSSVCGKRSFRQELDGDWPLWRDHAREYLEKELGTAT
jgi:hypothetical protein